MKVGVIGTGFGGRVVAPAFAATDGCEVADVVTARDARAVSRLVARPDVQLVAVHSPPFLHAPHVRAAIDAGKAVLCDKPLALDADEAAELEADVAGAGILAFCNFEFRYAPARVLLRELLRDRTIGDVEHIAWTHWSSGTRVPLRRWGWLFDRDLGGGWVGAWCSHAVDTIRFVFERDVREVRAVLRIDVPERPDADARVHACTAEDGLAAALVLDNGAAATFDGGFAASVTIPPRLVCSGSAGAIEVVADARITIRRAGARPEVVDVDGLEGSTADRHAEPMRRFAAVIRDALADDEIPPHAPTFADGRACAVTLDALRAAPFARDLLTGDAD
jgi:predicted dehydrogenase